jgi:hypothetical protein
VRGEPAVEQPTEVADRTGELGQQLNGLVRRDIGPELLDPRPFRTQVGHVQRRLGEVLVGADPLVQAEQRAAPIVDRRDSLQRMENLDGQLPRGLAQRPVVARHPEQLATGRPPGRGDREPPGRAVREPVAGRTEPPEQLLLQAGTGPAANGEVAEQEPDDRERVGDDGRRRGAQERVLLDGEARRSAVRDKRVELAGEVVDETVRNPPRTTRVQVQDGLVGEQQLQ